MNAHAMPTVIRLNVTPDGQLTDECGTSPTIETGDHWYVLCAPEDSLQPDFTSSLLRQAAQRRDIGVFYCDVLCGRQGDANGFLDLKPEFDLTLLIAQDYIGLPIAVQATTLHKLGGTHIRHGSAASYELLLRALDVGVGCARIPETLVTRPERLEASALPQRKTALQEWLIRSGNQFDLRSGRVDGTLQLVRRFKSLPEVTLVVPTRQSRPVSAPGAATTRKPFIVDLLDSISRLDYPMDRIQVIVGDDVEDGTIYQAGNWPFELQRIVTCRTSGEKFNYAAKMNLLWRASQTNQIVFMNDDITTESRDWLQALLTFSMQEDVGGAGARLLYPNGTIQHAGIAGGLFGVCAHAWLGMPSDAPTYQNWAEVHREWSIVTGAVFATRRSLMEEINGFDERLTLEFNDVDLCLRLRMLGYRIVYTPFAELVHHEKASRGETLPPASELALFLNRWQVFLQNDPSYHPGLTRNSFAIAPSPVLRHTT